MFDAEGRLLLAFSEHNFVMTPTNVMGGVRKMFLLCEDQDPDNVERSVAATTSGLGTLNGVVIAELADRFRRKSRGHAYTTAAEVLGDFVAYIRPLWETQVKYAEVNDAMRHSLDDLQFLASGYGPDDEYIKVFRISIANETVTEEFAEFPHCSAAWAGQANAISSLINGFNPSTRWSVNRAVVEALKTQRETLIASVLEQLKQQGVAIPDPFEAQIDAEEPGDMPWWDGAPSIDWSNLPVQSAVDLASTLVNAESAIQKFAAGIATVGGRTRIGLMRRGVPFEFLNEPEVVHHHVGYNHDA